MSDGPGLFDDVDVTIDVADVNEAPIAVTLTNTTTAIDENTDTSFGVKVADIVVADDALGANTLGLTGADAGSFEIVGSALRLKAGVLDFETKQSYSVQVTVNDATVGGDPDAISATFTVNVTDVPEAAINHAPSGADGIALAFEDTTYVFSGSEFGFSDSGDSPPNQFLAVKISSVLLAGSFLLNGNVVSAGTFISASEIAAGHLTFAASQNENGGSYASLTFQVQDDGGTAGGGVDLDPTPNTLSINVGRVNDAPEGTDHLVATNEDTPYVFAGADFGLTDPVDALHEGADILGRVKIVSLPSSGTLLLNGIAIAAGDFVTNNAFVSGEFTFVPAAGQSGAAYASFTFQVEDDGGVSHSGANLDLTPNTITIDVIGLNDAPIITSSGGGPTASFSVPENTSLAVDVNATDEENDTITYSIDGGADAARFSIDSLTGELRFFPNANFEGPTDANADNLYEVIVKASDGSLFDTQALSITVTNVNEAPEITSDGGAVVVALSRPENSTAVTDVNAVDPDAGAVLTYSISGGADAALFSIDSGTGVLSFVSAPDFENPTDANLNNVYEVDVSASDGILTDSQAIRVTVTNVAESTPATIIDLTALSAAQGFIIQGDAGNNHAGTAVGGAGDFNGDGLSDVIVGAPTISSSRGSAYLIFGSDSGFGTTVGSRQVVDTTGLPVSRGFEIRGDTSSDLEGHSVAFVGDLNGDGLDDVVIGAPGGDDGGSGAGEAYVVLGKASGFGLIDLTSFAATDGFIIQGDVAGDQGGFGVSSAGDVNGDGYKDLLVGALDAEIAGETNQGETYLIFGTAGGFGAPVLFGGFTRQVLDLSSLTSAEGIALVGDAAQDEFGTSVSSAGDVNGDGYADLIVGAPLGNDGGTDAGEAYVFFGKASGFSTIDTTSLTSGSGFVIQGDSSGDQAGISVSSAGDVNGDGYDDLIVGAHLGDDAGTDAGEAYVVFGSGSGFGVPVTISGVTRQVIDLTSLSSTQGFVIKASTAADHLGNSVSAAGDMNGDGFDDIIVGAPDNDSDGADSGIAYVVFGTASGFGSVDGSGRVVIDVDSFTASQGFIIRGDTAGDTAGASVSAAGDVNHDGFDDLIVGAPLGDDGGVNAGEAYIVFGGAFGLGSTPVVTTGTGAAEALYGGLGNDTISGSGGADLIRSGSGDDTLSVADLSFRSIDAGGGTDTLKFLVAGTINFGDLDGNSTTSDRGNIAGVEVFDVTNSQANALTLSLADVLDLDVNNVNALGTALDNVLAITGDVGDTLALVDPGTDTWAASGGTFVSGSVTYQLYTAGPTDALKVAVDTDFLVSTS